MIPTAYVVDVGQGSCNVIITSKAPNGGNNAVVVDCGPRTPDVPMELMVAKNVTWISDLVVSHRDRDHCGGLEKVLGGFKNRIERVFFTGDCDSSSNPAFRILDRFYNDGFLETDPANPKGFKPVQIGFEDPYCLFPTTIPSDDHGSRIFLIAPTREEADDESAKDKPNQTSAIVVLKSGSSRIVFPGDATIPAWESLATRIRTPLRADVMIVPHHGGLIHVPGKQQLKRLYGQITRCDYAVISAGTNNKQGGTSNPESDHPRTDVLQAIYEAGLRVVCTEMTSNCSCLDETAVKACRNVKMPTLPSFSKIDRNKVACAGTICMVTHRDRVEFIDYSDIHDDNWKTDQLTCCPIAPDSAFA